MSFRAQLQQVVGEHGGEYSGDLTKDVTHLIANSPDGKKYAYATQWQKKVVGIKWLKETLERGMQLDESLYHPTKPKEEQGIGAWNRQAKLAQLGKRSRETQPESEPARKLRRTASARLGSQNDSLWGDIVAGDDTDAAGRELENLRPSKSMPVMRPEPQVPESFSHQGNGSADIDSRSSTGIFAGKSFYLHGFHAQKVIP